MLNSLRFLEQRDLELLLDTLEFEKRYRQHCLWPDHAKGAKNAKDLKSCSLQEVQDFWKFQAKLIPYGGKSNATAPTGAPIVQGGNLMSPQLQRANFGGVPGPPAPINNQPGQIRGSGVMTKAQSAEPPAVWKPPPPHGAIAGIYEKTLYLNSFLELTCICDQ